MIETLIQMIVDKWDSDTNLYKEFPNQDRDYPFVTFKVVPAAVNRSFCADMMSFSVVFTIFTQQKTSAQSQTMIAAIKTIYNRTSLGILSNKITGELVVKDPESGFYSGSSTYLMDIRETV